ncbi:Uncharacterised protein [Vibrio cholerae]|nr:Uncharacterised protein [Vibrio cholerae]
MSLLEPAVEPVITGTSSPTIKEASPLSITVMLGDDRIFELESLETALIKAVQSPIAMLTAAP